MNKAELIERIVDTLVDPWTDCPEDYLYSLPIDICEAEDLLAQIRDDEKKMDIEYAEMLPKAVTPALVMEAYNCLIRAEKHAAWINRMADYLIDNECVCEYDQLKDDYLENPVTVLPMDFLQDDFPFETKDGCEADPLYIIELTQRSKNFHTSCEYCYYDKERDQLISTDCPFHDGVIDAHKMAEYIIDNKEVLNYFLDSIMDDDDIQTVFGCKREQI